MNAVSVVNSIFQTCHDLSVRYPEMLYKAMDQTARLLEGTSLDDVRQPKPQSHKHTTTAVGGIHDVLMNFGNNCCNFNSFCSALLGGCLLEGYYWCKT